MNKERFVSCFQLPEKTVTHVKFQKFVLSGFPNTLRESKNRFKKKSIFVALKHLSNNGETTNDAYR
jgi:hypothetical protein